MINEEAIRTYLLRSFKGAGPIRITRLGSGVQGAGFLIEMETDDGKKSYVVKSLLPDGFGHDYPSDRAAVFLLDLDEYGKLDRHVRAIDVLAELPDGTVRSVGGGREYYLMMERAVGRDYFHDLREMAGRSRLLDRDVARIRAMTSYLAGVHAVKKDSKTLYRRKLRDTVGHGECLMGVFDLYPEGAVPSEQMAETVKRSVDWVYRLRPRYGRLSQVHGDFHPGNIWFRDDSDFVLLDRSRGPWGEPADDVTALAINYIFFSVMVSGDVRGAHLEGLNLFFEEYLQASGDREIPEVVAPFFAFRGAVVANPSFYPELSETGRGRIFNFVKNVLNTDRFEVEKTNTYLDTR